MTNKNKKNASGTITSDKNAPTTAKGPSSLTHTRRKARGAKLLRAERDEKGPTGNGKTGKSIRLDSHLDPIKNILETLPGVLVDPVKQFSIHLLSCCPTTAHSMNLVQKQKDDP